MNPRDVARAARQSINVALDRLAQGDALLVFAEGTRSRSRDMQQMLAGAARYLECSGAWILPVGLTGTYVRQSFNPRSGTSPHWFFGHGMLHAAMLAKKLGHRRITSIEFGVAGGNGTGMGRRWGWQLTAATPTR